LIRVEIGLLVLVENRAKEKEDERYSEKRRERNPQEQNRIV